MVDVVANHMGIGDISSYVPFNSQSDYHDCNGCPANCQIEDWDPPNQPQVCVYVCECVCVCVCVCIPM